MSSSTSSSQSLDEPRQLIMALLPKFKSSSDVSHILALKTKINSLSTEREKILKASVDNVNVWLNKLETAKVESVRPVHMSKEKQLEKLASLEKEKFTLAKQIRDAETSIESFDRQLVLLQQELHNLKKENMEPIEISEHELRLRIYRSLGVSILDEELPATGKARIMLKNLPSKDFELAEVDAELNSFESTNKIWEFCSSPSELLSFE